jgi:hypothetical protein
VIDYARFYNLEGYLFGEIASRYKNTRQLSAFDFFCIIIWKANRAKSKVASRLLGKGHANLSAAVTALVASITNAQTNKERLRVLVREWGFRLPMASAILTVLFPDDFTVYDVRVCEVLSDFTDAQHKSDFDELWGRYTAYVNRVRESAPIATTLRDKDRYLWGQSFATQLHRDIESAFRTDAEDPELEA